jgi:Cu+-exporting ATPase
VERALTTVEAVSEVHVDLATESAAVAYEDDLIDVIDLVNAVDDSGYKVPVEDSVLPIGGMTCAACIAHVEGALRDVAGVVGVNVKLATEKATVTFVPGTTDMTDFKRAVEETGYEVLDTAV